MSSAQTMPSEAQFARVVNCGETSGNTGDTPVGTRMFSVRSGHSGGSGRGLECPDPSLQALRSSRSRQRDTTADCGKKSASGRVVRR